MAYIPEWERLADSRRRVMAAGGSKREAQRDICRALADQKIKIRYLIGKEILGGTPVPTGQGMSGHVIWRPDVIPRSLASADFDWRKSRPVRPWQLYPNPVFWELDWIELYSADVTRTLVVPRSIALVRPPGLSSTRPPVPKRPPNESHRQRHRPAQALAAEALKALFGRKIPGRTSLTDQKLCGAVQEWLKANDRRKVSCDSILRAAKRAT